MLCIWFTLIKTSMMVMLIQWTCSKLQGLSILLFLLWVLLSCVSDILCPFYKNIVYYYFNKFFYAVFVLLRAVVRVIVICCLFTSFFFFQIYFKTLEDLKVGELNWRLKRKIIIWFKIFFICINTCGEINLIHGKYLQLEISFHELHARII